MSDGESREGEPERYTIVVCCGNTERAYTFRGDLNAAIKEARHVARTERTITAVESPEGRILWDSHFATVNA